MRLDKQGHLGGGGNRFPARDKRESEWSADGRERNRHQTEEDERDGERGCIKHTVGVFHADREDSNSNTYFKIEYEAKQLFPMDFLIYWIKHKLTFRRCLIAVVQVDKKPL